MFNMNSSNTLLRLEGISKAFGGLRALNNVTFAVEIGKITALVGPNGAGKTTVFNIISGFVKPDLGKVTLNGQRIDHLEPYAIAQMGVARTFQTPRVLSYLTLKENVLSAINNLSGERLWEALFGFKRAKKIKEAFESCELTLGLANMTNKADILGKELNFVEQKMVNVLQSIISEAKFLLMDEPTVGLDSDMQHTLTSLLRRAIIGCKRGILLVEHNMEFVMNISDYVLLLVEGRVILRGTPADVKGNEIFRRLYLGV